uniref:Uncharacterized protein n=1 Tax=Arundo donax TaxID=35708 RepID=A0A0A9AG04_ARUDO
MALKSIVSFLSYESMGLL